MLLMKGVDQRSRILPNMVWQGCDFPGLFVPLVGVGTLVQGTTHVWEAVNTSSGFN